MTGLAAPGFAVVVLVALAASAEASERMPDWVPAPNSARAPGTAGAPAVVLLREREIRIGAGGRSETSERVAIRCLTASCGDHTAIRVPYMRGTQNVVGLRAWVTLEGGTVRTLGGKDVVDAAADPGDLYDESRVAMLSARREVVPGALVAFEWTRRDSAPFPQVLIDLQERLPVATVRCTVILPEGWRVSASTFNHAPIEGREAGRRTTWTVEGLAYRPDEPLSPAPSSSVPLLALTVRPPPGQEGAMPAFASWDDVGRWTSALFDPAAAGEPVASRMRDLARNTHSPRDTFEEAARFVQGVTYVSIQLELGRGGGYRPRPAAETLRRGYGDCKDKVTLLRALLAAAGIRTRPVLVSSRGAGAVRGEFPSPFWFDHAILAVSGVARGGEPVVSARGEGPLLLFDPTDSVTPPGQLPEALWGGSGLVAAPEGGALVTIPSGNARLVRRVSGELAGDGTFRARLHETGSGSAGESLRSLSRRATREEIVRGAEEWIARSVPGVRVEGADIGEEGGGPSLEVRLAGRVPGWQDAGKIAVLRPVLLRWRGLPSLATPGRRSPVVFPPTNFSAEYRLRLPARYSVSELPPPVLLERSFGRYAMTCDVVEGTLVVTQELRVSGSTVPLEGFAEARDFVSAILTSSDASVVLKREW